MNEAQRTSYQHHPQLWLAVFMTLGELALLYAAFMQGVPEVNQRIADVLVGAYTATWGEAMRYWYGTTYGSNNKTDLLAKADPIKPL